MSSRPPILRRKTMKQWREPQFFKPIIPPFKQLSIPRAFLKHLVDDMREGDGVATLRNYRCTQKSWRVKVKEFCFTKGWNDFVSDNDLGFGDFVVFAYKGSMVFEVKIFNRNCCEKEHHHPPEDKITHPPRSGRLKTPSNKPKAAKDSFEILITENSFRNTRASIPKYFAEANGFIGKITQAVFRDERGLSWLVKLMQNGGRVRMGAGWLEFLYANRLKERDLCVFKLVNFQQIGLENAAMFDVTVSTVSSSNDDNVSSPNDDDVSSSDDDGYGHVEIADATEDEEVTDAIDSDHEFVDADDGEEVNDDKNDDHPDDVFDEDDDDGFPPVFKSENDYFSISFNRSMIKQSRVTVPRDFVRRNGLEVKNFSTKVIDGNGRRWCAHVRHYTSKAAVTLSANWARIGFKERDCCDFELCKEDSQVTEFRMHVTKFNEPS